MSIRNDLLNELESLTGSYPGADVKKLGNDELEALVEKTRAEKEATDQAALAVVAQDTPEIPKGYKFRYPLQVAPGISIHCKRGLLKQGDEVKPTDGEIGKLVAHGKVLTGPGFEESMLGHQVPVRSVLKPPPKPGARRK